MLSLDDPHWNELRHAYGGAGNIPGLLRTLKASPGPKSGASDEPWFTLWSSLCHQGDVYTASYAAIPHIVGIATEADGPVDSSFFHMPAAVEIARVANRGPALPDRYAADYHSAIRQLVEIVKIHRNEEWDRQMLISATAALAVAKGHIPVAEALLNLDDDWIARMINDDFD